jgi:hypothetical protein
LLKRAIANMIYSYEIIKKKPMEEFTP